MDEFDDEDVIKHMDDCEKRIQEKLDEIMKDMKNNKEKE